MAIPALCVAGVCLFAALWPKDEPYAVVPRREPAGTFAVEGYLRGELARRDGPEDITVVLTWTDDRTREEGGGLFRVRAVDRRFRVAGVACRGALSLSLAVMTDDGRGGTVHVTLGGNSVGMLATSGDLLKGVRVDLARGWSYRGRVRDAQTGAPVEGVTVSARHASYGRDGWAPLHAFTRSDARGEWTLHGVQSGRLADPAHPMIQGYRKDYPTAAQTATVPADTSTPWVDLTLTR